MKAPRLLLSLAVAVAACIPGHAQYATIANQVTGILGPMLTGGFNYKGYVDASYIQGFGENNGNFLGVSTSQGWRYGSNFFMGLGLGVDCLFANVDNSDWNPGSQPPTLDKSTTKTGCVIPVFTDFRGIIGNPAGTSCQLGLKMGCSFLVSSSYILVNRGYITSNQCFYLKPSVGVRVALDKTGRKAFTAAVAYQLMTPDYRHLYGNGREPITLNGLGVILSYEW